MKEILKQIGIVLILIIIWLAIYLALLITPALFAKVIGANVTNAYLYIAAFAIIWTSVHIVGKIIDYISPDKTKEQ